MLLFRQWKLVKTQKNTLARVWRRLYLLPFVVVFCLARFNHELPRSYRSFGYCFNGNFYIFFSSKYYWRIICFSGRHQPLKSPQKKQSQSKTQTLLVLLSRYYCARCVVWISIVIHQCKFGVLVVDPTELCCIHRCDQFSWNATDHRLVQFVHAQRLCQFYAKIRLHVMMTN